MLLDSAPLLKEELCHTECVMLLGLVLMLTASSACAQGLHPPCVLEVPVYDATGNKLDFSITAVTREDDKNVDFLKAPDDFRMTVSGNRVYFPKNLARGLRIELTLEGRKRGRLRKDVPLLACEQRVSARYGELDSGADVSISTAEGHLSGCRLDGDWWIRTMPMFGTADESRAIEGYVRTTDGSFRVDFPSGERLIVVVGRDREPVKVFAVNVTAGARNNIGNVDLSGSCPK